VKETGPEDGKTQLREGGLKIVLIFFVFDVLNFYYNLLYVVYLFIQSRLTSFTHDGYVDQK
jgi:hypothetical protein